MTIRSMIFVLPGGGYETHAANEAAPVAGWLASLGHFPRVLYYPVSPARYPTAFDAVRREISAARKEFDGPIGVIGFSAGGHLAGQVALAECDDPFGRPDFAILGYPVTSLGANGHHASRLNLLGDQDSESVGESLSLPNLVAAGAPPFFLWHTADDESVSVSHTLDLGHALAAASVSVELHIFPTGAHGLGLAAGYADVSAWTALCAAWLQRLFPGDTQS